MMSPSPPEVDLLTCGWIPVLDTNGERVELGVVDVLRRAPSLLRITDPSPLVTFGIHRLLGAVLHAYLPLTDEEGWSALWEAGRFPEEFPNTVAVRCRDKMRLFDAERPFYQTGDIALEGKPSEALKSIGYLAPEASTGTNIAHFSHAGEAAHAFCPVCCAKGLIHLPCFATAGGAGIRPGISGVPPLYLLPRGVSLFQTLMLNFLLPDHRGEPARDPDPGPLWETHRVIRAKEEHFTTGFVESLTWPPRRIRLFPDRGGTCSRCGRDAETLVRRMVFAQGWSRAKDLPPWRDAWAAYERRKAKGADQAELLPIRPTEYRDVWRDFPSLFLQQNDADTAQPLVLEQLSSLLNSGCLNAATPVMHEVFGLRTDMKAKIFEWRQETYTFPLKLLQQPSVATTLREALDAAGDIEDALIRAFRRLFPEKWFNAQDPLVYTTRRAYWQTLESEFRLRLNDERLTGTLDLREAWKADWCSQARDMARNELERVLRNFDADADQLRRQVRARDTFYAALAREKGGQS